MAKQPTRRQIMSIPDAEKRISKALPDLLDRMIDLAMGAMAVGVVLDADTGAPKQRVYQLLPDQKALSFLIEHGIGRVPQRVELTGKEGKPMEIIPWMPQQVALEQGLKVPEIRVLPPGREDEEVNEQTD
jgi:hypothetical protein